MFPAPHASTSSVNGSTTMRDFQIIKKLGTPLGFTRRGRLLSRLPSTPSFRWPGIRAQKSQDDQAHSQGKGERAQRGAHPRLHQVGLESNSLRHPNIIAYKEAFFEEDSQSLCIIMEYANGGDLYLKIVEHTKRNSYFPEKDIWKFFIHMVRGLQSLHDLKILHRDLKVSSSSLLSERQYVPHQRRGRQARRFECF